MNLKQLECICAVEEHGSLSAAAKSLGVTQQALSKSLKSLEQELGVELFFRANAGMLPNPDTLILLKNARGILNDVSLMSDVAKNIKDKSSDVISVGILPGLIGGPSCLVSIESFVEFAQSVPGVHFQLSEHSTQEIGHLTHLGYLDIGIVNDVPSPRCVNERLYQSPIEAIVLKSSPLAKLDELTWKDMEGTRIVCPFSDSIIISYVVDRCMDAGFLVDFIPSLTQISGNISIVRSEGAALLCFAGENILKKGQEDLCVKRFKKEDQVDYFIQGIWNKDRLITEDGLKLLNFFKQQLNKGNPNEPLVSSVALPAIQDASR